MGIAETLMITNRLTPSDAALAFARAGFPIFPCVAEGKRPLTPAGFHEATRDIDQVLQWWRRWPRANVGMPTGAPSGVDVVDIDVTDAGSGFVAIERATQAGIVDGELARVRTPSGGLHIYYPTETSRDQRCWQAASAHIDFRGSGGYVIVPPSTLAKKDGKVGYRLFSVSTSGGRPIDSLRLRRLIDPQASPVESRPATHAIADSNRLARWVRGLQEGERNHGLFWAACRLAEAGFDASAIEDALAPAATSAGLLPLETASTIRSASRQAAGRSASSTAEATWSGHQTSRATAGEPPCLP